MNSILSFIDLGRWLKGYLRREVHRNYLISEPQNNLIRIIGNGPSLADVAPELKAVPEIDYCMVNFSPLSDLFFRIKPKYYILTDDAFFIDVVSVKQRVDMLREKVSLINWNIYLLVPYIHLKEAKRRYGVNHNINFVPFNRGYLSDGFKFKGLEMYLFEHGMASPRLMNVVVAALYCLLTLGYKKIELYGVEHSWMKQLFVDDDNYVCMEDPHFYDTGKNKVVLYTAGRPERIWEQLRNQADTFAAYGELQLYADKLGAIVINKTRGSYIDSFKREYE